ncbi:MAG: PQQ-like beta-propeller repeat protein, partial [Planctomycetaceae bacterium]|nr:PQQ-like beta-propeller repeat protein [Planctomycetaceae bacterium]
VLWVRELGQGYSGFVVSDDRVYTQYQTLAGQYVVCLDAESGDTIWEYWYDWPFEATGLYPGPRATPTIASGRIYFAGPSGLVGCLSKRGKLVWSVNVTEKFDGRGTEFGYSCTPTVVDGMVILPVGGKGASMVALDANDGSTLWKSGDDSASYTPALPITVDGHRQVLGYLEYVLAAFDLKTGRQLWRVPLSSGYDEHAAWPIYSEPYVWISGPFRGGSQLLKLTGGTDASYERVWESQLMSNDVASSVLIDGHLYGFDLRDVQAKAHRASRGSFRCIEMRTGKERWANGNPKARRTPPKPGEYSPSDAIGHASVIVADGKLILFNDTGELILAKANPERCEVLARVSVLSGEICWTPPALHRGRLFLRNPTRAACLFLGKPELRESKSAAVSLTVADIPQHEHWDFSQLLGVEPEYAFDVPSREWLLMWYVASLVGVLGVSGLLTFLVRLCVGRRMTLARMRRMFWTLAFLLGAIATTPLSLWRNEFVFTWPVALFISFQATVYQIGRSKTQTTDRWQSWRSRAVALGFVGVCLSYFLICRRLSLVTEWVFLAGFVAALPFLLLSARLAYRHAKPIAWELLLTAIAFSAYYWGSTALLFFRYEV